MFTRPLISKIHLRGIFLIVYMVVVIGCAREVKETAPAVITTPSEQQWTQTEDDSLWSGWYEWDVMVSIQPKLDPWTFAWEEDADEKIAGCEAEIESGEISDACPTTPVLVFSPMSDEVFSKELSETAYANIPDDLAVLPIGCYRDLEWTMFPIWWVQQTIADVVLDEDQTAVMDALEMWTQLRVRLSRSPYEILWRWGTLCDVAFTKLEVLE